MSNRRAGTAGRLPADVSIIICTRDRADGLPDLLSHLAHTRLPEGWRVELLMVDNGSTDGTLGLLERAELPNLDLRYVAEPRPGKVQAFTTGVEHSTGRVLLMTDDDVHVPPNWIEDMCRPILEGQADAVQGGVKIAPHLERPWLKGVLRQWVASVEDPDYPPEGLVGANMACRRDALQAVLPLDPRLGPGAAGFFEDTVLGWELERLGYRKIFLPKVAVEHHFEPNRLTIKAFMAAAQRMATARVIIDEDSPAVRTPPSVLSLLPQLPGLAARGMTQLALLAAGGRPDAGFMARYYYFLLWRKRRAAARTLAAGGDLRPAR